MSNTNSKNRQKLTSDDCKRFKCDLCCKRYSSKKVLLSHQEKYHKSSKFICDSCGLHFDSKQRILRHLYSIHHLKKMEETVVTSTSYKCGACKKVMTSKQSLERHKRSIHMAIYEFLCEFCSATYRDRYWLNKHLKKYHNHILKPETHNCSLCRRDFTDSYRLEKHETLCKLKEQESPCLELDFESTFVATQETISTVDDGSYFIKQEPEVDFTDIDSTPANLEQFENDPFDVVIKEEDELQTIVQQHDVQQELDGAANVATKQELEFIQPDSHDSIMFTIKELTSEGEESTTKNLVTKFKCKSCLLKFNNKAEFRKHFMSTHAKLRLSEPKLFVSFEKLPKPNVPKKPERAKKIICELCNQLFESNDALEQHHWKRHTIEKSDKKETIKFHCVYCPLMFESSLKLQRHFRMTHKTKDDVNNDSKIDKIDDDDEQSTDGEPDGIDEEQLQNMFSGKSCTKYGYGFECTLCSKLKSFSRCADLRKHLVERHRIKKFKCKHCNHSFAASSKHRLHWSQKHRGLLYNSSLLSRKYAIPDENIRCVHCSDIFSHKDSLKRHVFSMHNPHRPILYCDQCGDSFIDSRTLNSHIIKNHQEPTSLVKIIKRRKTTQSITCWKCGEICFGKIEMLTHRLNVHFNIKIVDRKRFHCLLCREVLLCRASAFRHHNQVHLKGKKLTRSCLECRVDFEFFDELKKHIEERHRNSFICLICGLRSLTANEQLAHSKLHRSVPDDEKQIVCDLCGFKAQQKITIENHMAKMHGAKKKEFSATCEICGATFSCYQPFHTHRKLHQLDKSERFKCSYCEKSYYSFRDLRNHEGIHTNPKGDIN